MTPITIRMVTPMVRSSMRFRLAMACAALTLSVLACEKHEFEPPSTEERVANAEEIFSQDLFDTIIWESPEARSLSGNVVFASKCRKCHGTMGTGGTAYALERNLDVPSLVEEGWELDGDLEGARHRMFVGHAAGMPTWGVAGISLREIDAVAHYVLDVLRPEVLGTPEG